MSNEWFRFYNDSINDPKLLRLSDEVYRAWTILLCLASKNGGTLPPTDDIALTLRLKPSKVAEWIAKLVAGGLLDNNDGVFSPHNWHGRQYKSDVTDVTAADRMRKYRERKKVSAVTVTAVTDRNTVTDTVLRAEQIQNRAEAEQNAPRAVVNSSEKVLRSDLMDLFPNAPNYDRTSLWLEKGYQPSMIVEVVREVLARGQVVASLAYFDAALADRHSKRPETPSERAAASNSLNMDSVVQLFAATRVWSKYAGPEPGLTGCRAPADLLAKHGLGVDGQKLRVAV